MLHAHFLTSLQLLYSAAFTLPGAMGYGDHWKLNEVEKKQLADATDHLLKSVPQKYQRRLLAQLDAYMPFAAFATTLGMITWPRVVATQQMSGKVAASNFTNRQNAGKEPSRAEDKKPANPGPDRTEVVEHEPLSTYFPAVEVDAGGNE